MGSSLSFTSVEVNSLYYSEGESTRPYRAYLTSISIPGIGKPSGIWQVIGSPFNYLEA
jgi:hypothetical protein